jgi:putative transposase
VTPSRRRPVVSYLHDTYRVSERRACRVARIPVSRFRYESRQEPRTALRLRIREIAQVRVRYGCRKIRVLLKREGWNVGKKLVYRLYKEEGLTLQLADGRRFRALTILDVFTRESLAIAVGQRLKGEDVVATLNEIRLQRGVRETIQKRASGRCRSAEWAPSRHISSKPTYEY